MLYRTLVQAPTRIPSGNDEKRLCPLTCPSHPPPRAPSFRHRGALPSAQRPAREDGWDTACPALKDTRQEANRVRTPTPPATLCEASFHTCSTVPSSPGLDHTPNPRKTDKMVGCTWDWQQIKPESAGHKRKTTIPLLNIFEFSSTIHISGPFSLDQFLAPKTFIPSGDRKGKHEIQNISFCSWLVMSSKVPKWNRNHHKESNKVLELSWVFSRLHARVLPRNGVLGQGSELPVIYKHFRQLFSTPSLSNFLKG